MASNNWNILVTSYSVKDAKKTAETAGVSHCAVNRVAACTNQSVLFIKGQPHKSRAAWKEVWKVLMSKRTADG